MTDWTAGYVADIGYTFGYYTELNPARIQHAFLSAGLVPPQVGTACELGFGQGLSTAIHAAASTIQWFGTDFNPAQAGFAQDLVQASESGARLYDQAFGEFCERTDLPDFDYIGLHGIWSWISDDNRRIIVDFVRRRLKVGGVLYISYNTEPGWAAMVPMRRLLTSHSAVMSPPGMATVDKVNSALEFADRLLASNPIYARANPQVAERIKNIKGQNRHYVAHEYFNQDWDPMAFSTLAEWLEPAKLNFACSTHLLDHIASINLSTEQQALLATLPDQLFRESVRDFICNQTFRRDYWVRGARRMTAVENLEAVRTLRVLLLTPRSAIELKTKGALGTANMSPAIYEPLLDLLADYRPKTVAMLEQQLAAKGLGVRQILEALQILAGNGNLTTVQDDKAIGKARPRCDKLNAHLMNKARNSADISYLASPVTGGGVSVGRFDQLFLLGRLQGRKSIADLVELCYGVLMVEGSRLLKDGQVLDSEAATREELTRQANEFTELRLPLFKALGLAG